MLGGYQGHLGVALTQHVCWWLGKLSCHRRKFLPGGGHWCRPGRGICPRTEPWETPEVTSTFSEQSPSKTPVCDLLLRKAFIRDKVLPRIPYPWSLWIKVIVGHIFETSIKCLCFIRSQWNFVCMFFKAFWTQLNKFRGKLYILKTDFVLQTCVNFWPINSKNEKYTSYYDMGYLEWSNEIRIVSISGQKLTEVMFYWSKFGGILKLIKKAKTMILSL